MSPEPTGRPSHSIMGSIHELLPPDESPESLARVLRHECDECDGVRVVVDLTDQTTLDGRHVKVMIESLDPAEERWTIWLPNDVDADVIEDLRSAGFEGRLLMEADES